MGSASSLREPLVEACRTLLRDFNDVWVLSAITDYSFEEGNRSSHFANVVQSYVDSGVPAPLAAQMRKGINGNLAEVLASRGAVTRNKWKGQDLLLTGGDGTEARVEVKQVFDCTLARYYDSVAADLEKLKGVRGRGFGGELFLVVFFVQLPNFRYAPRLGKRKVVCGGIVGQYERVCAAIGYKASWPDVRPFVVPLTMPRDEHVRAALQTRFEKVHGPASETALGDALEGAGAGMSLWELSPDR
jgi:hypothetical protein